MLISKLRQFREWLFGIPAVRRAHAQKVAEAFWKNCPHSELATSELYENQEREIRLAFFPRVKPTDCILDLGCADGRFTFVMAEVCQHVSGFDLSNNLINSAGRKAKELKRTNVTFRVADITKIKLDTQYEHVSIMGVFTTIPDKRKVMTLLKVASTSLKPGGSLILKDSLSLGDDRVIVQNEYAASYRSRKSYFKMIEKFGFTLDFEKVLGRSFDGFQDCSLFIFSKKSDK